MTRAGPSQSLDLDGAPIAPRVTLPRRKIHDPSSRFQIDVFLTSRVLGATDGISRLFLQISVHRGHPESLNLRGHRRGETVPLIVRTKRPLNRRVSSSLETIVV